MTLPNTIALLIGFLHFYIAYLEIYLWNKPKGLKAFNMNQEKAEATKVLAANQGLYNAFLGSGFLWGVFNSNHTFGLQIILFFSICVFIAGVFGARTVHKKIFYIQSLPAAACIAACWFAL